MLYSAHTPSGSSADTSQELWHMVPPALLLGAPVSAQQVCAKAKEWDKPQPACLLRHECCLPHCVQHCVNCEGIEDPVRSDTLKIVLPSLCQTAILGTRCNRPAQGQHPNAKADCGSEGSPHRKQQHCPSVGPFLGRLSLTLPQRHPWNEHKIGDEGISQKERQLVGYLLCFFVGKDKHSKHQPPCNHKVELRLADGMARYGWDNVQPDVHVEKVYTLIEDSGE
mmetsp:Transcript_18402/g.55420  ORF Transcript_18402/g.55420 Transcript_18402/m.55420 type:complete len:224 (+) Transcript_18402:4478-5149(+)